MAGSPWWPVDGGVWEKVGADLNGREPTISEWDGVECNDAKESIKEGVENIWAQVMGVGGGSPIGG